MAQEHGLWVHPQTPLFCNLTNPRAALFCPVRVFWPLIRCRVAPGQPTFSAVNRRNFNRILKAALSKLRIPEADRYSSHAFRRGASQELKESGPPGPLPPPLGFGTPLLFAATWIFHGMSNREFNSSSMSTWAPCRKLTAESVRHWAFLSRGNPLAGLPRPLFHVYRGFLPSWQLQFNTLRLSLAG